MPTPARRAMSSSGALAPCSMMASRAASRSSWRLRRASARIRRVRTGLVASGSGATRPPICGGVSSAYGSEHSTEPGNPRRRPARVGLGPAVPGSVPRGDGLHGPAVAVRVLEEQELAPGEFLDVADLDSPPDQLRPRGVDVGDDQLQALHRAGPRLCDSSADGDRAGRPRRGELHEADLVVDPVVVVGMKAGLVGVEGLGAVHVRDGDCHQFELPVHAPSLPASVLPTKTYFADPAYCN